ncbi:MAG: hypothetical protein Q7J70_04310, partial [Thermodesulfovibrionales bacterium]|nr:hypothetical protein [Thermodesulfovibrionales bacterium]
MIQKRRITEAQKRRSKNGIHTFALLFFCSVALSFLTSCGAPRYGYFDDYPIYDSQPIESPKVTKSPLETKYIFASW